MSSRKHLERSKEDDGDIQPLREDGISKKALLCDLSPILQKLDFCGGRPYYHLDGAKCNQVCKTRHQSKFASFKWVQLAPRSFCHAVDGTFQQPAKFNFSTGESRKTSSRSAAPSAPLVSLSKHLECSKGDCGDKEKAICCRSSCE